MAIGSTVRRPAGRTGPLSPAVTVALYRNGMSACEIAGAYGITRGGAEARIRAGGLGGLQWCPVHYTYEELRHVNAKAVSYVAARRGSGVGG